MRRLAIILTLAVTSTAYGAEPFQMSLEGERTGELPQGWIAAKTGNGPGSVWKVVADSDGKKVLAQTSDKGQDGLFNLCVAESSSFTNIDLSVRFKAVAGKQDQGGGPVWRYRDSSNYYIGRMNPLEDNFRVYKVVGGKRIQLASADVKAAAGQWHTIRVVQKSDYIQCYLNGKSYLDVKDDKFKSAGKIGLWTKADAQTYFADLRASEVVETKAAIRTATIQIALLKTALNVYQLDAGSYPKGLDALRVPPADLPPGKWEGPYLEKDVPLDPWGKPYQYRVPGVHNSDSFDVWTVGPDGKPIGNWKTEKK